jgi:hypothetical protein
MFSAGPRDDGVPRDVVGLPRGCGLYGDVTLLSSDAYDPA